MYMYIRMINKNYFSLNIFKYVIMHMYVNAGTLKKKKAKNK